jgi:WXG100 protein secretion system (Wss), protein YukD
MLRWHNYTVHRTSYPTPLSSTLLMEGTTRMADVEMTLVQPSGASNEVEMPDDVPIGELIPDFISELRLPATQTDGTPVIYKVHSKSLGRELDATETLASAGVPVNSPLLLAPFAIAGASCRIVMLRS